MDDLKRRWECRTYNVFGGVVNKILQLSNTINNIVGIFISGIGFGLYLTDKLVHGALGNTADAIREYVKCR